MKGNAVSDAAERTDQTIHIPIPDVLPETNHVGVYHGPDDIRVEERPMPVIGPGDVLVRTSSAALCAGEAMPWYHASPQGKTLGHEVVGVVARVGENVTRFKPGDRIFAHHHFGRMLSHQSLRGHFTIDPYYKSVRFDPGSIADYFRLPAQLVEGDSFIVPDSLSDDAVVTIEPWSCVLGGLKVCGIQPGDTVLVIGAGFMGVGFAVLAPLFGAGRVIVSDFNPWRRAKALELGANAVIDPSAGDVAEQLRALNDGLLADVVVEAVPNAKVYAQARELVEPGGTLHLAAPGAPGTDWVQDSARAYFDEVTVTSKYSADHHDTFQYFRLLKAGRIDPSGAITHHFPLSKLPEAFKLLEDADKSLKIVLRPDDLF